MGHDEHFLQRLDRVAHQHLDIALGLYRDHDLTRFILTHARAAEGAERIAIALDDSPDPPHVVVAKNGVFVTCLGASMSTAPWPVVSHGQLEAIAAKFERVREGLELAKKRGIDEARLLDRLQTGGATLTREDYRAATALLGPAAPVLLDIYKDRLLEVQDLQALLRLPASGPMRKRAEIGFLHSVWSLAHSATIVADAAPREWIERWAERPVLRTLSPWTILTTQCALPFVLRAAWVVARMGKPLLPSYKARFAKPDSTADLYEAGWGLAALGLRHASLRGEIFRFLRAPPPAHDPMYEGLYVRFDGIARLYDEKEDHLREEGRDLGRKVAAMYMKDAGPPAPQFDDPSLVPDDLALPALFGMFVDANHDENGTNALLIAMVSAAQAKAEDFYWPASAIRATGASDAQTYATALVEMQRKMRRAPKTVRSDPHPGRNDPCSCGSGKKYKKCHGA